MEAAVTYKDLAFSFADILHVDQIEIRDRSNEHASLRITALLDAERERDIFFRVPDTLELLYTDGGERRILFSGMLFTSAMRRKGKYLYLTLEARSHTWKMDLKKKIRSFQNLQETCGRITEEILKAYPGCIWRPYFADSPVGQLLLQYEETDWEFLKRLAGKYHARLYPRADMSGLAFGMGLPDGKQDQKAFKALNTPLLYSFQGAPDREKYYYYKSILGVQRILDYLTARPEWDGRHLVMDGQSQGGAFSLMMAALYPKVTAAAAEIPALCDHRGPQAGWPRLLAKIRNADEMSGYYDTAFFCREIRVPVIVAVGMIDTLCPPRSVLAAFNSIPGQEKRLVYGPFTGHGWGKKMKDFESLRLEFIRQQLTK